MRAERVQRPGLCPWLPVFTVRVLATSVGVIGLGWGPASGREPAQTVDFDREIRPLLADNCFQCHGPDERARKSKLRLDRRKGVLGQVTPGRPATSTLLERIASSDPAHRMPPPGTGRSLTSAQVARVRAWISQGARWTRHWSLRPILRAMVPAAVPGPTHPHSIAFPANHTPRAGSHPAPGLHCASWTLSRRGGRGTSAPPRSAVSSTPSV